jgi:hypothetical protein
VGCGQGVALELFLSKGYHPIGIASNDEDIAVCKQKGYQVYKMDQSFLETLDISFEVPAGPDTYWAFFQQK